MSSAVPVIAVVGHTNTGKTSLMRTLLRDTEFGEVSNRPAVTRRVEGANLLVDSRPIMTLYDTPGLEDSIALREHLDRIAASGRFKDDVAIIECFLDSPEAAESFAQEARAVRQLVRCDAGLYVIDARQPVLAKYRDELAILARCGRPIIPVLNFVASDQARTAEWREQLSRLNLHAVAEFDTVVFDEVGEQRLFEKMRTLLDEFSEALNILIEDRGRQRRKLIEASARIIAEMLIHAAAAVRVIEMRDGVPADGELDQLRNDIRDLEQKCVDDLLESHRFDPAICDADELPLDNGQWGTDLFSPEAIRQFGLRTGGGAAAGAMAGLTIDLMLGGASLGLAAGLGAAAGGLLGLGRTHGRRIIERIRGRRELRCDDTTLVLLARRQIHLVRTLLHRGHASMDRVQLMGAGDGSGSSESDCASRATADPLRVAGHDRSGSTRSPRLPAEMREARLYPDWSAVNGEVSRWGLSASRRRDSLESLAEQIRLHLEPPPHAATDWP